MISFDAIDLYTMIPYKYGLEAIYFRLESYPEKIPECIYKFFMIESIRFVLQKQI